MGNIKFIFLKIYFLNFISQTICQYENDSISRIVACMTIVGQKYEGREPEATIYSTMLLKCFISISESQIKKVMTGIESGQKILSKREIDKLTDYESLRDMSASELQKKTNELEKALKKFRKIQDQFSNGEEVGDIDPSDYDDDYDNDYYNSETPSNINFFSLIPKGIAGIFNIFNSYLSLFIVFVIVYFGLFMLRKINDSEKKMKKKNKMMQKRMKDEYEEEENEESEEEEKYKKGYKKMKRK